MNDRIDDLVTAHKADIYSPPPATVQRWHDALDTAAGEEAATARASQSSLHPKSFFMGMAIAATLALGIAIGVFFGEDDAETFNPDPAQFVTTRDALSRGLQVHFRDSREQLMELPDSADRTMLVLRIIEQNRMFARFRPDPPAAGCRRYRARGCTSPTGTTRVRTERDANQIEC